MADRCASDIPQSLHDTAADLLNRRLAGEFGIEAKIAKWAAVDERHRLAFDQAQSLWADSGGLTQSATGSDGKLTRAPFYRRQRVQHATAAVVALVVAGVGSIPLVERGLLPSLTTQAHATKYRTTLGEVRDFALGEGVTLTLDTHSRAEVSQEGDVRRVNVLEGRVRLRDRTGTHRFLLATDGQDIEVRGKRFDASLIEAEDASAVRVVAIDAPIKLAFHRGGGAPNTVSPGTVVDFMGGEKQFARTADTRWPDGLLVLDQTPLADAVAASNRFNRVKIRVVAAGADGRTISGAFQIGDPATLAAALARLAGLRVERQGDLIMLVAPSH